MYNNIIIKQSLLLCLSDKQKFNRIADSLKLIITSENGVLINSKNWTIYFRTSLLFQKTNASFYLYYNPVSITYMKYIYQLNFDISINLKAKENKLINMFKVFKNRLNISCFIYNIWII